MRRRYVTECEEIRKQAVAVLCLVMSNGVGVSAHRRWIHRLPRAEKVLLAVLSTQSKPLQALKALEINGRGFC